MWTADVIAENVREKRKTAGLTQIELAELSGLEPNSISKWEYNHITPRSDTICKLCNALGCTPNDLMWRADDES